MLPLTDGIFIAYIKAQNKNTTIIRRMFLVYNRLRFTSLLLLKNKAPEIIKNTATFHLENESYKLEIFQSYDGKESKNIPDDACNTITEKIAKTRRKSNAIILSFGILRIFINNTQNK